MVGESHHLLDTFRQIGSLPLRKSLNQLSWWVFWHTYMQKHAHIHKQTAVVLLLRVQTTFPYFRTIHGKGLGLHPFHWLFPVFKAIEIIPDDESLDSMRVKLTEASHLDFLSLSDDVAGWWDCCERPEISAQHFRKVTQRYHCLFQAAHEKCNMLAAGHYYKNMNFRTKE